MTALTGYISIRWNSQTILTVHLKNMDMSIYPD